ncbi:putative Leucine--tRNA ligase [Blattamonas nauphoetae]|uniref:Leucine--tRNA ligase n=1 Tax=Blattamonas nauphoetae TaxID=2049346 RepID=A0ABQ9XFU3_9EUKA|nr:putative Leucine--tRNA ligase [Blattamonas nauphoetae]
MSTLTILKKIEQYAQRRWDKAHTFEDSRDTNEHQPKFFITTPMPYADSLMSFNRGYVLAITDIHANYQALKGKNVLFSLNFHYSGTSFPTRAKRLRRELEGSSTPAPRLLMDSMPAHEDNPRKASKPSRTDVMSHLLTCDVPESDLKKFEEPRHWLEYFSEAGRNDTKSLGARVNWNFSLEASRFNKFFASFVNWTLRTLKNANLLRTQRMPVIWSEVLKQPCLDHDRVEGFEAVPINYLLLKHELLTLPSRLQFLHPFVSKYGSLSQEDNIRILSQEYDIFCVSATLRSESLMRESFLWVHPNTTFYGFECTPCDTSLKTNTNTVMLQQKKQILICTERAARNLFNQNIQYQKLQDKGQTLANFFLFSVKSEDLVNCLVASPLSPSDAPSLMSPPIPTHIPDPTVPPSNSILFSRLVIPIVPGQFIKRERGTGFVEGCISDNVEQLCTYLQLVNHHRLPKPRTDIIFSSSRLSQIEYDYWFANADGLSDDMLEPSLLIFSHLGEKAVSERQLETESQISRPESPSQLSTSALMNEGLSAPRTVLTMSERRTMYSEHREYFVTIDSFIHAYFAKKVKQSKKRFRRGKIKEIADPPPDNDHIGSSPLPEIPESDSNAASGSHKSHHSIIQSLLQYLPRLNPHTLQILKEDFLELSYKHGVVSSGLACGMTVKEARSYLPTYFLKQSNFDSYYEANHVCISVAGDECVVRLSEERRICYGNEEWKQQAQLHLQEITINPSALRSTLLQSLTETTDRVYGHRKGVGCEIAADIAGTVKSDNSTREMSLHGASAPIPPPIYQPTPQLSGGSSLSKTPSPFHPPTAPRPTLLPSHPTTTTLPSPPSPPSSVEPLFVEPLTDGAIYFILYPLANILKNGICVEELGVDGREWETESEVWRSDDERRKNEMSQSLLQQMDAAAMHILTEQDAHHTPDFKESGWRLFIDPEEMTDAVWNYLFRDEPLPQSFWDSPHPKLIVAKKGERADVCGLCVAGVKKERTEDDMGSMGVRRGGLGPDPFGVLDSPSSDRSPSLLDEPLPEFHPLSTNPLPELQPVQQIGFSVAQPTDLPPVAVDMLSISESSSEDETREVIVVGGEAKIGTDEEDGEFERPKQVSTEVLKQRALSSSSFSPASSFSPRSLARDQSLTTLSSSLTTLVNHSHLPVVVLKKMKETLAYWNRCDLRVMGDHLLPNHGVYTLLLLSLLSSPVSSVFPSASPRNSSPQSSDGVTDVALISKEQLAAHLELIKTYPPPSTDLDTSDIHNHSQTVFSSTSLSPIFQSTTPTAYSAQPALIDSPSITPNPPVVLNRSHLLLQSIRCLPEILFENHTSRMNSGTFKPFRKVISELTADGMRLGMVKSKAAKVKHGLEHRQVNFSETAVNEMNDILVRELEWMEELFAIDPRSRITRKREALLRQVGRQRSKAAKQRRAESGDDSVGKKGRKRGVVGVTEEPSDDETTTITTSADKQEDTIQPSRNSPMRVVRSSSPKSPTAPPTQPVLHSISSIKPSDAPSSKKFLSPTLTPTLSEFSQPSRHKPVSPYHSRTSQATNSHSLSPTRPIIQPTHTEIHTVQSLQQMSSGEIQANSFSDPTFAFSDIADNNEQLWNEGVEEVVSQTSDSASVHSTSFARYNRPLSPSGPATGSSGYKHRHRHFSQSASFHSLSTRSASNMEWDDSGSMTESSDRSFLSDLSSESEDSFDGPFTISSFADTVFRSQINQAIVEADRAYEEKKEDSVVEILLSSLRQARNEYERRCEIEKKEREKWREQHHADDQHRDTSQSESASIHSNRPNDHNDSPQDFKIRQRSLSPSHTPSTRSTYSSHRSACSSSYYTVSTLSYIEAGRRRKQKRLLERYAAVFAHLISPLCPHWAEYVWVKVIRGRANNAKRKAKVGEQKWMERESKIRRRKVYDPNARDDDTISEDLSTPSSTDFSSSTSPTPDHSFPYTSHHHDFNLPTGLRGLSVRKSKFPIAGMVSGEALEANNYLGEVIRTIAKEKNKRIKEEEAISKDEKVRMEDAMKLLALATVGGRENNSPGTNRFSPPRTSLGRMDLSPSILLPTPTIGNGEGRVKVSGTPPLVAPTKSRKTPSPSFGYRASSPFYQLLSSAAPQNALEFSPSLYTSSQEQASVLQSTTPTSPPFASPSGALGTPDRSKKGKEDGTVRPESEQRMVLPHNMVPPNEAFVLCAVVFCRTELSTGQIMLLRELSQEWSDGKVEVRKETLENVSRWRITDDPMELVAIRHFIVSSKIQRIKQDETLSGAPESSMEWEASTLTENEGYILASTPPLQRLFVLTQSSHIPPFLEDFTSITRDSLSRHRSGQDMGGMELRQSRGHLDGSGQTVMGAQHPFSRGIREWVVPKKPMVAVMYLRESRVRELEPCVWRGRT